MVKVVPCPGALLSSIQPLCCRTMPSTTANPRPVPLPTSFVVKNGSKILDWISWGMPQPVSLMLRETWGPGVRIFGF